MSRRPGRCCGRRCCICPPGLPCSCWCPFNPRFEIPAMSDPHAQSHDAPHDGPGPLGPDPHTALQYQPALPIPNGKTCLWLFLSTEIMFFAGLIGAYIVLRFGAEAWPATHDVHLVEIFGAVNTAVLIMSSITVVLALEAAKKDDSA